MCTHTVILNNVTGSGFVLNVAYDDINVYVHTTTLGSVCFYLAPGGGCEVLFSPGLSVCLCVCLCICVSGQYFGILFIGY